MAEHQNGGQPGPLEAATTITLSLSWRKPGSGKWWEKRAPGGAKATTGGIFFVLESPPAAASMVERRPSIPC